MKNLILVLSAFLFLSSCIGPTRSRDLSDGTFEVFASGSILASKGAYLKRLDKKAKEICGGEYEEVSKATGSTFESDSYIGTQAVTVNGSTYSKIVRCKS